jgi:hypothetical protein
LWSEGYPNAADAHAGELTVTQLHRPGGRMTTTAAVIVSSLAVLFAIAVAVGAYASANRRSAWRRVAASRRELRVPLGESHDLLDEYWATATPPRRPDLLLKLAQIETAAAEVLDRKSGPRAWQLFEIRSELRRLGIWSDDDVITFDRAMRLRNEIVHSGSAREVSPARVSADELDKLLAKVLGNNDNTHVA